MLNKFIFSSANNLDLSIDLFLKNIKITINQGILLSSENNEFSEFVDDCNIILLRKISEP